VSQVLRLSVNELRSVPLPLIAHYNWRAKSNQTGHYIVVTRIANDRVEYIDGTTAEPAEVPLATFEFFWSGHVVSAVAQRPFSMEAALVASNALLAACWIWIRVR
jgi:ABC-type bacteriocin/lantibiotic exporter with double-glycine peptidase domain